MHQKREIATKLSKMHADMFVLEKEIKLKLKEPYDINEKAKTNVQYYWSQLCDLKNISK